MVKAFLSWLPAGVFFRALLISILLLHSVTAAELKTIAVEITTHLGDQQTFVEGDVISFLVSLDRDAYVYLFYQDASANIFEIFPNLQSNSHLYRMGFFMPIPPSEDDFQFKIQAPFGSENLFVFASDNADIKLDGRLLDSGIHLIDDRVGNLETNIRRQSISEFGSASMTIVSRSR